MPPPPPCRLLHASSAPDAPLIYPDFQARDWANGDKLTQDIFGRQYIWNLFAHNSPQYHDTNSPKDGYNQEEWKMVEETPKIFEGPFRVGVTCIRVPVLRAHCESINLQFKRKVTLPCVTPL